MSMPTLVPASDRAPSLASRVVTIHATDVTEGAPAPDSFVFSLPCALRVPADDVILRPGGVKVRLVDGRARVRLPVYSTAVQTVDGSTDWVILVTPSWGRGEPYPIRVPVGTSDISLADLPAVRPLTRREREYAITGVGVTVTEGAQAGGSASYANGQLDLKIQVPSFRPQTVYPYIDQTADARAEHYGQEIRADLDERLAEVTTAYELAVTDGYEGTLTQWLASLRGPKGDKGADSTVPGPTGKTAYEYAVEAGFEGTEQEFAAAQLPETVTWGNVDGKPATFPPESHTHTWDAVTGKPTTFSPAAHQHALADVTGLESRLDGMDAAISSPGAGWETLPGFAADVTSAGHGAPPQILRLGVWRYIRGRFSRTNGTSFSGGANYQLATLDPADRPKYTQGGIGQGTQIVNTRVEVSASGAITSRPSADTAWMGVDGVFWTTN